MIKPKRLKPGDKVAIVSLSWGGLGEKAFVHKYHIAADRLKTEFGLQAVAMPHALMGSEYVAKHPENRANDLMEAFKDPTIAAIICAIGGDDTIRILPYIDWDIIRRNPKIFMGYSDSTINHFMMYRAGLVSFYGPSIMCEFGEYNKIFDYTKTAIKAFFFRDTSNYPILSSPEWSSDFIPWDEKNIHLAKKMRAEEHGYEVLQGKGKVSGHLLGGCIDVFLMAIGTEIWPALNDWKGAIFFWETSEEKPKPDFIKWMLRNLAAQGILKVLSGMIIGKPQEEIYYEEYKAAVLQVVAGEEKLTQLPIIYNVNFGHAMPIGILPYGVNTELDCEKRTITLLESAAI